MLLPNQTLIHNLTPSLTPQFDPPVVNLPPRDNYIFHMVENPWSKLENSSSKSHLGWPGLWNFDFPLICSFFLETHFLNFAILSKRFPFFSLLELDKFCWTGDPRKPYLPVILTGDFNTTAESNVYELLANGQSYYHGLNHCGLGLIPTELGITDSCQHYDIGK